ncbi:hypothetical protein FBU30_000749 [Linnemannia zychae]|nr:hypothetical protein FBU30_000749 [Linnemannia zychae]
MLRKYNDWLSNSGDAFWESRSAMLQIDISTNKAVKEIVEGSDHIRKRLIDRYIWSKMESSIATYSTDLTRKPSCGLEASPSKTATTSAFYDPKSPFLDTSMPVSSPKGTPSEGESVDVQVPSDTRAKKRGRMDSGPTKDIESHNNSEEANPTVNLEQFVALNQEVEWIVQGEDLVQKFQEFRAQNLHDFSLARDSIADVTIHSKFRKSLAPNVGRAANRVDPISNLHKRWPTLNDVLERVFAESHYDCVDRAIAKENLADPVVSYIVSIIHS